MAIASCTEGPKDLTPEKARETRPAQAQELTVTDNAAAPVAAASPPKETASADDNERSAPVTYWGVEEGEALTLNWEDLMPEGSEEELSRLYAEFYASLDQQYAANATTLADAAPYGTIEEGSVLDFMPQLGTFDVVEELDGQEIRIPGYVVPFDFDVTRNLTEFLFVPYMGACIHTPPPPPNQLLLVRAEPAVTVKDIWVPFWAEGKLNIERTDNDLGNTAYTLTLTNLEPYPIP